MQLLWVGCRLPRTVILYIEIATIQALRSMLGAEVRIKCCFYHLTQSTWRKIQELELSNFYGDDENFRLYCGINARWYCASTCCRRGVQVHPREFSRGRRGTDSLYFDVNYVRGTYRRIQRPNRPLRVRHMPPRFSPPLWNVHDATIQCDTRTNNQCELVKQQVFFI